VPPWGASALRVVLIALLAITLQATPADSLQIRFVGNAGFELSDGATTLLIDLPYESGAFDLMTYDPTALDPVGRVVSVVTHRHVDHFDPSLFTAQEWDIVGPEEVTSALAPARVLQGRIVMVGDFRIQRFSTPHSDVEHFGRLCDTCFRSCPKAFAQRPRGSPPDPGPGMVTDSDGSHLSPSGVADSLESAVPRRSRIGS